MRLLGLSCLLVGLVGICVAQDMSFPVGPHYLMTTGSPIFARPLATPSLSLGAPLPDIAPLPEVGPIVVDQPFAPNPELEHQPDLFPIFYGYPMPSVVELVSPETPARLPESMVDVGVIGMTDVSSLRERDTERLWEKLPRSGSHTGPMLRASIRMPTFSDCMGVSLQDEASFSLIINDPDLHLANFAEVDDAMWRSVACFA